MKILDLTIPQDHIDLKILITQIENHFRESLMIQDLKSSSNSTVELETGERVLIEANYFPLRSVKYWSQIDIDSMEKAFNLTNELSNEYRFEPINFEDYEVEYDEDRYWLASISFRSHKKC